MFYKALPSLSEHYPELKAISPICYYGWSNLLNNYQPEDCFEVMCGHGNSGILFKMLHRKDEAGLLILEDLTKGTEPMFPFDKTKVLSLNQAKAAVRALATFHGIWWTWMRNPNEDGKLRLAEVEEVYSKGKRQSLQKNELFQKLMKTLVKLAGRHGNEDMASRLKDYFKRMWLEVPSIEDPPKEDSVFRTLVHGDAWVNNMMFSSNDPGDENLRVKLLDFQGIVMGHPARDLWYLLQIGTDVDFRRKHLETVFREYYIVFSSYLEAGGLRVEFTSFRDECEKLRAPVSLLLGNIVLFLTLNPEPLPMDTWTGARR